MATNQTTNGGNALPLNNSMVDNIGNYVGSELSPLRQCHPNYSQHQIAETFTGYQPTEGTIDPNLLAIQQMHAADITGWKGGEEHYAGPHDDFCFVCGSAMKLFGCQTCESSYHANCMTPTLISKEVPRFWFCPHCVAKELHIPPSGLSPPEEEHFFAPLPSSLPLYPPTVTPASSEPATNTPVITKGGGSALHTVEGPPNTEPKNINKPVGQQPTPPSNELPSPDTIKSRFQEPADFNTSPSQKKPGRPRHSSPPRKKSKYSAFSKEVDKALSVIYGELETAAGSGKSEGNLEIKIQALEQQLKMQKQQMLLMKRELEFARNELAKERQEATVLKVENVEIREENARLKEFVGRKENELQEWRAKLRSMIGSELQ